MAETKNPASPIVTPPAAPLAGATVPPAAPPAAPPAEPVMVDGVQVCGFPVAQGTENNGQKVTKPCIKTPGHEGDHSTRKYTKLDLTAITDDMLGTLEEVPGEEADVKFIPLGDRSPQQQKVDEAVLAAHELHTGTATDASKRPQTFAEAIKAGVAKRYFADLENMPAIRKMLQLAGEFHEVRVRIDKPRRHTSGRTMLYWFATDRPAADDKPTDKSADDKTAEKSEK